MKLYSWNINGLRAVLNKGSLVGFLAEHDPDIVCLQETKIQSDQLDHEFAGYHFYLNSGLRKGHFGTGLLSKVEPIEVTYGFSDKINRSYDFIDKYGNISEEGRVLNAEYEDYIIVTSYTPNSKGDLSRLHLRYNVWDQAFREHCLELNAKKPVLISGDLNVAHQEIDLARPKDNKGKHGFTDEERLGMTELINAGFSDTFRDAYPDATDAYTWWTHWGNSRDRNIGWRIDYWLASTDIADLVQNPQIHPDVKGSDHCPVSIEVN